MNSRAKSISYLCKGLIPMGSRILDVGSGPGVVAYQISKDYQANVQCVDIKNRHRTELPFQVYDGQHLPYKNGEFDIVLLIFTLHHCQNPNKVLSEAKRVCRWRIIVFEDRYKTHFQLVFLMIMDFLLNFLSGTSTPFKFKTVKDWLKTFQKQGLSIRDINETIPRLNFLDLAQHVRFVIEPKRVVSVERKAA